MTTLSGSIGNKIILVVSSIVTIALVIMMFLNLKQQEYSTLAQNERDLAKLTETVSQALQTLMLAGYANIAHDFAARLGEIEDIEEFHILRVDGREAFLDNETIKRVNAVRGDQKFTLRDEESENRILMADFSELRKALFSQEKTHFYTNTPNADRNLVFISPVLRLPECHACHGTNREVLGLIYVSSSLTPVYRDIEQTQLYSLLLMTVTIVVIVLVTGVMIRRTIVQPVQKVIDAMSSASDGDLSQHIPVISSDEIGAMAQSFNRMIEKLLSSRRVMVSEQKKLSTIILSTREGVIATNSRGDVVLVNPAAEKLLGKTSKEIVNDGLLNLLDKPSIIEENLHNEVSTEIVWLDRVISLYASVINGEDGLKVGSAVLLRDVTAEKQMEEELRKLSITDELTGLYNRRCLDTLLSEEIALSSRYHLPLSILFFDIDHFKKFNDEYGHEQGDRVLQDVAEQCRITLRETDKFCRYGGEEFLIILSNTEFDMAINAGERLRVAIQEMRVDGLQVTISIGVANYPSHNPLSMNEFINAADKALYRAKSEGRNRVVASELDLSLPGH